MNKELYSFDLLEKFCNVFGPSGCEEQMEREILSTVEGCYDELLENRTLGVIALIRGNNRTGRCNTKKLMLSCHTDEVGFMIKSISEDGTLKVTPMGSADTRVMACRRVMVGDGERLCRGVFAVKPIHLLKADERDSAIPLDELYIDIGADSKEEAEKLVKVGDFATYESDYIRFGEDMRMIKAKAIDDRAGCAIMCDLMRKLYPIRHTIPFDMYFAFTRREELGISGARGATHLIDPDHALIFESTAVSDICGTAAHTVVAKQGDGPAISLLDRATIYDGEFTRFILDTAEKKDIPCQIKQYVSGGNDAGHIHKSRAGVKCAVLSIPSRYIHTPSNVIRASDFENTYRLGLATVEALCEN